MYEAVHKETHATEGWDEAQVRTKIIKMFQHDMPTVAEYTDEEIAAQINESDLADHFTDGVFEGVDYTVTVIAKEQFYLPQHQARLRNRTQRQIVKPEFWEITCEFCGVQPSSHPYGNVCATCSANIPF